MKTERPPMRLSTVVRSFDLRHVGTCWRCMRISFATLTVSWVLLFGALWLWPDVAIFASIGPIGLTAVWIAHVVAHSARAVRSEPPENYSRRLAIRTAVMAVAGAAAVSVMSRKAHADGLSPCGGFSGQGPESGCRPCPNNCYRQSAEDCSCFPCDSCCNRGGESGC
jgi:hypothetical protein